MLNAGHCGASVGPGSWGINNVPAIRNSTKGANIWAWTRYRVVARARGSEQRIVNCTEGSDTGGNLVRYCEKSLEIKRNHS